MYANLEEQDSAIGKISKNLYLIVSISLLTHTTSITYSVMSFRQLSAGFISIIVSSLVCFFLSASHLTIYGISVLGILYLMILQPYYSRPQLHYIVAISGVIIFPFWKIIHSIGSIFNCLPGRIHAGMVFGIALIVLTKFFPLAIENMQAFFVASMQSALTSPIQMIILTFQQFNYITLALTILSILAMFVFRKKLERFPLIAFLVIIGILINWTHYFLSYQDLCIYQKVDCHFYILKLQNLIAPTLKQILNVLPASIVMTAIIIFQQFLYLQQFQRRGKRFGGQGNLGQVSKQSRILALANTLSGCLGGLPICINLFGTYENFAFNQKYGFNGTKLVGLMQLPVSYLLYSILKPAFDWIPLFVLFAVVATPTIYFLKNMLFIHKSQIIMITIIAVLNVITHPVIALIFAALVSVYDLAQLLKAAPAQILMQNVQVQGQRKTATLAQIVQKQKTQQIFSQFRNKIRQIDDDQPGSLQGTSYIMYRFTGAVSYLNYFSHIDQLNSLINTYIKPHKTTLVISFRYAQIIDEQSLIELSQYVDGIRENHIQVMFTGLHTKLIQKMQKIQYFKQMLKTDQKSMYCIHPN